MPDFPLGDQALASLVDDALAEDVGEGDLTASVIPSSARLKAVMRAREPLVLAGIDIAVAVFRRLAPECLIDVNAQDGDRLEPGAIILTVAGPAAALLTAERTALNFVQFLSGIATLTRRYADILVGSRCRLLDTRKTIPGHRVLSKYATRCGGAQNHRMGLFDAVMIKDNHIAATGSIAAAVEKARASTDRMVEVECDTLDQVHEALTAKADRILLDNMTLDQLRTAVNLVDRKIPLEASGGVTDETLRAIADTGVDYVSVGRLTQSAPAIDIGLDYEEPA